MDDRTAPGGAFPPTRVSAVEAARSDDPEERRRGLSILATVYWKPVYKRIRVRWQRPGEDARDLTQEFFARLIEKDFLARFDPGKGRLRTFLRTCVDAMLMNDARDAARVKRGGEAEILPLDFESAERELRIVAGSEREGADSAFDREWVRSVFSVSLGRLRDECEAKGKSAHFRLFLRYDVEDADPRPTYATLAVEAGVPVTDVTNRLAYARREFRRVALETLRDMTASDEEFRREARDLFGISGTDA